MATYEGDFHIQITDVNGDSATTHIATNYGDTATIATVVTELATLVTALAACTNGKVTATGFGFQVTRAQISSSTAPPPANAVYPSVTDGAKLQFTNSQLQRRSVTIPAPVAATFITGSNTVNRSDTNTAAFIAAVEAVQSSGGAGGTNVYEGGVKVGHHARRRASRRTL